MEHIIITKDYEALKSENDRREREFNELLERKKEQDLEYEKLVSDAKETHRHACEIIDKLLKDIPEDVRNAILKN